MALDLPHVVAKLVAPLQRRVRLMISRAVVSLVDDARTMQTLQTQMLADEVADDVEHFQPFGFTSIPLPGAEGVFLSIGGDRDHGVIIAVDDRRYRPAGELAEGESALYTAAHGIRVWCKADGSLELGTAPSDFVALATNTENRLAALEAFALDHMHPTGVGPSGPATSASAQPPLNVPPAPVAATEVKAK